MDRPITGTGGHLPVGGLKPADLGNMRSTHRKPVDIPVDGEALSTTPSSGLDPSSVQTIPVTQRHTPAREIQERFGNALTGGHIDRGELRSASPSTPVKIPGQHPGEQIDVRFSVLNDDGSSEGSLVHLSEQALSATKQTEEAVAGAFRQVAGGLTLGAKITNLSLEFQLEKLRNDNNGHVYQQTVKISGVQDGKYQSVKGRVQMLKIDEAVYNAAIAKGQGAMVVKEGNEYFEIGLMFSHNLSLTRGGSRGSTDKQAQFLNTVMSGAGVTAPTLETIDVKNIFLGSENLGATTFGHNAYTTSNEKLGEFLGRLNYNQPQEKRITHEDMAEVFRDAKSQDEFIAMAKSTIQELLHEKRGPDSSIQVDSKFDKWLGTIYDNYVGVYRLVSPSSPELAADLLDPAADPLATELPKVKGSGVVAKDFSGDFSEAASDDIDFTGFEDVQRAIHINDPQRMARSEAIQSNLELIRTADAAIESCDKGISIAKQIMTEALSGNPNNPDDQGLSPVLAKLIQVARDNDPDKTGLDASEATKAKSVRDSSQKMIALILDELQMGDGDDLALLLRESANARDLAGIDKALTVVANAKAARRASTGLPADDKGDLEPSLNSKSMAADMVTPIGIGSTYLRRELPATDADESPTIQLDAIAIVDELAEGSARIELLELGKEQAKQAKASTRESQLSVLRAELQYAALQAEDLGNQTQAALDSGEIPVEALERLIGFCENSAKFLAHDASGSTTMEDVQDIRTLAATVAEIKSSGESLKPQLQADMLRHLSTIAKVLGQSILRDGVPENNILSTSLSRSGDHTDFALGRDDINAAMHGLRQLGALNQAELKVPADDQLSAAISDFDAAQQAVLRSASKLSEAEARLLAAETKFLETSTYDQSEESVKTNTDNAARLIQEAKIAIREADALQSKAKAQETIIANARDAIDAAIKAEKAGQAPGIIIADEAAKTGPAKKQAIIDASEAAQKAGAAIVKAEAALAAVSEATEINEAASSLKEVAVLIEAAKTLGDVHSETGMKMGDLKSLNKGYRGSKRKLIQREATIALMSPKREGTAVFTAVKSASAGNVVQEAGMHEFQRVGQSLTGQGDVTWQNEAGIGSRNYQAEALTLTDDFKEKTLQLTEARRKEIERSLGRSSVARVQEQLADAIVTQMIQDQPDLEPAKSMMQKEVKLALAQRLKVDTDSTDASNARIEEVIPKVIEELVTKGMASISNGIQRAYTVGLKNSNAGGVSIDLTPYQVSIPETGMTHSQAEQIGAEQKENLNRFMLDLVGTGLVTTGSTLGFFTEAEYQSVLANGLSSAPPDKVNAIRIYLQTVDGIQGGDAERAFLEMIYTASASHKVSKKATTGEYAVPQKFIDFMRFDDVMALAQIGKDLTGGTETPLFDVVSGIMARDQIFTTTQIEWAKDMMQHIKSSKNIYLPEEAGSGKTETLRSVLEICTTIFGMDKAALRQNVFFVTPLHETGDQQTNLSLRDMVCLVDTGTADKPQYEKMSESDVRNKGLTKQVKGYLLEVPSDVDFGELRVFQDEQHVATAKMFAVREGMTADQIVSAMSNGDPTVSLVKERYVMSATPTYPAERSVHKATKKTARLTALSAQRAVDAFHAEELERKTGSITYADVNKVPFGRGTDVVLSVSGTPDTSAPAAGLASDLCTHYGGANQSFSGLVFFENGKWWVQPDGANKKPVEKSNQTLLTKLNFTTVGSARLPDTPGIENGIRIEAKQESKNAAVIFQKLQQFGIKLASPGTQAELKQLITTFIETEGKMTGMTIAPGSQESRVVQLLKEIKTIQKASLKQKDEEALKRAVLQARHDYKPQRDTMSARLNDKMASQELKGKLKLDEATGKRVIQDAVVMKDVMKEAENKAEKSGVLTKLLSGTGQAAPQLLSTDASGTWHSRLSDQLGSLDASRHTTRIFSGDIIDSIALSDIVGPDGSPTQALMDLRAAMPGAAATAGTPGTKETKEKFILFEAKGKKFCFDGQAIKEFICKEGDPTYDSLLQKVATDGTGQIMILNDTYTVQGTDWAALSRSYADTPNGGQSSLLFQVDHKTTDSSVYQAAKRLRSVKDDRDIEVVVTTVKRDGDTGPANGQDLIVRLQGSILAEQAPLNKDEFVKQFAKYAFKAKGSELDKRMIQVSNDLSKIASAVKGANGGKIQEAEDFRNAFQVLQAINSKIVDGSVDMNSAVVQREQAMDDVETTMNKFLSAFKAKYPSAPIPDADPNTSRLEGDNYIREKMALLLLYMPVEGY